MAYRIEFYNTNVQTDVLTWPAGIAANFAAVVKRIVEHGPNLGLPYTRPMGDGLFEIRARGIEGIGRALFCTMVGQRVILLHGFIKKTPKTPVADLRIARKRLQEIHHG